MRHLDRAPAAPISARHTPRARVLLLAAALGLGGAGCDGHSRPSRDEAPATQMGEAPTDGAPAPVVADRHIAYEIDVELEVDDVGHLDRALAELTATHGGHISDIELTGEEGTRGHGRWTLKIAATERGAVLEDLRALGQVGAVRQRAEDVTAQVMDVDARLKARRAAEARLMALLAAPEADLEGVLALEAELARVREAIEVLEATERAVKGRVALTTIHVEAHQRPSAVEQRLGPMMARTLEHSWFALGQFLTVVLLFVVALLPWSPLLAGLVGLLEHASHERPGNPRHQPARQRNLGGELHAPAHPGPVALGE